MDGLPVIDTSLRQWTIELGQLEKHISDKWKPRLRYQKKANEPLAGTFMPQIPWYHANWNEDSPEYDSIFDGAYTNSQQYRDPDLMEGVLNSQDVDIGILSGHVIRFLPSILNKDYATAIAKAYNELLLEEWINSTTKFKAAIALPKSSPKDAVSEISKYKDHSDVIAGMIFSGGGFALGHDKFEPIYSAAADANLPIIVYTYGDPVDVYEPLGPSQLYPTFDTNISLDHMTNIVSIIFQGILDKYSNLKIVWAGEGFEWVPMAKWRSTRYFRNLEPNVPYNLKKEPHVYFKDNFYFTTFPYAELPPNHHKDIIDMVGFNNIIYGSGYPDWNCDRLLKFSHLNREYREAILHQNANNLFGLELS